MTITSHRQLVSFIWKIADDCLRDVYVRGKYRDVILPMLVLRRFDILLADTQKAIEEEIRFQEEELKLDFFDEDALKKAAKRNFFNKSGYTLETIYKNATNNQQILLTHIREYLNGFSTNIGDIIERFDVFNKMKHMADKQVLLDVIERFIDPYINLSAEPKRDPDGNLLPALDNHGMGSVFEELIRRFNEENNEEAGEHFTPRDVIKLMAHLVLDPVKETLPNPLTLYDPACGSGGMLTEAEVYIQSSDGLNAHCDVDLIGKEVNDETYAICKSDLLIKNEDPHYIRAGSTLSTNEFAEKHFNFMLSNPPYGKSWSIEEKYIKDLKTKDVIDPRFKVRLADYWGEVETLDATPRTSDGQLLFLMDMIDKIKPLNIYENGSRIGSVHNGSALFTGDGGSGESNIRRYIIESDMLEAIIQLPNNIFYNTGITTYIWILSNHKADYKKGRVQLIDGSLLFKKLRKNLGQRNCELSPQHIDEITQVFTEFKDVAHQKDKDNNAIGIASKIFDNQDFGFYDVTIEHPDRRYCQFEREKLTALRFDKTLHEVMVDIYKKYGADIYQTGFLNKYEKEIKDHWKQENISLKAGEIKKIFTLSFWEKNKELYEKSYQIMQEIGENKTDFNMMVHLINKAIKKLKIKFSASEKKKLLDIISWYDESAPKVINKTHKFKADDLNKLCSLCRCTKDDLGDYGYYLQKDGTYITYATVTDLRDNETVPLKEGITAYFNKEVKPYSPDAWIDIDKVKIGYKINFNQYFYYHKPLPSLQEITKELLELEDLSEGLMEEIFKTDHSFNTDDEK